MELHKSIHRAIKNEDMSELVRLLDAGVDIEDRDDVALTPLIEASRRGSIEMVEMLIERGADISAKCEESWTAVAYALMNGHFDLAIILERAGADMRGIYQDVFIDEDTILHEITPMKKLISNAAGGLTWEKWEAYRAAAELENKTPPAQTSRRSARL